VYKRQIKTTENKATLTLRSYSQILKERSAEKVRTRDGWYQYKTIPFLIRELLKLEFSDENGELPDTFTIPQTIELADPDDERLFSILGRPPTNIDTNSDGVAEKTYDSTLTPRWLIGLSDDPTSIANPNPFGNNVDDNANNITYLVFGCDHKLYSYCIATDVYELLGSISSDYHIERLWLNNRDGHIYGVAITSRRSFNYYAAKERIILFEYDGTSISEAYTSPESIDSYDNNLYSGYYSKRRTRNNTHSTTGASQHIGSFVATENGYNLPIPFSQYLIGDATTQGDITNTWEYKIGEHETDDVKDNDTFDMGRVPRGFLGIGLTITGFTNQFEQTPCGIDFTFGQRGFFLFAESCGSKGSLIYANIRSPILSQNVIGGPASIIGEALERVKIIKLDISTLAIEELSSDLTNEYTNIGYTHPALGIQHDMPVHPTTGAINGDYLYICGISFGEENTPSLMPLGYAILKMTISTKSISVLREFDTYSNEARVFLDCIHYSGWIAGPLSRGFLILISYTPYVAASDSSAVPILSLIHI